VSVASQAVALGGEAPRQRPRVLGLVGIALLPLLALAALSAWQWLQASEARVAGERLSLARAAALRASAFIDGNLSTIETLVETRAVNDPASEADLTATLNRFLAANPEWEGAGIADGEGWNLANTAAPPYTLNIGDRPYFQKMLATHQAVVSPAVLNRRTGNPTIVLAVPIHFASGELGAFIVALSTSRIGADLQALGGDGSTQVVVFDSDGSVFIHPDPAVAQALLPIRGRVSVETALSGGSGTLVTRDSAGRELLVAYASEPLAGWGVLVAEPTAQAFDLVRRQLGQLVVLLLAALAITAALGWYLGGRLDRSYGQERAARARAEAAAIALRDISAESERRRLFLENLIQSSPVAIAVTNGPEHRFSTVNPAYQAFRPGVEMLGRTYADVFPELRRQGREAAFDRVYGSGRRDVTVDNPLEILDLNGSPQLRYFTTVLEPHRDADGAPSGVLAIVLETTETVLSRQRAERAKDEFLSIASHELKTPLTSLSLSTQMLERLLERGTLDRERFERLLAGIRQQVDRASLLIGDLLDVSRLEFGHQQLVREPVDLRRLVSYAIERQDDTLLESDPHQFRLEIDDGADLEIVGDETRLDQVLTNLLSNAIKYSPAGGLVTVSLGERAGSVDLRVADQGIGISETERGQIFSPFSRTRTARESGIQGTGLGLYITRRIVEAHGGTITFDDTPGGGATFTVTLPHSYAPSEARA
jgi:signal transduction histidine kinase